MLLHNLYRNPELPTAHKCKICDIHSNILKRWIFSLHSPRLAYTLVSTFSFYNVFHDQLTY